MSTQYLTREKYDELANELELLKHDKRKEIADSLEYAKSLGDLSENAEYQEAREAQSELEARIQYIEEILKDAEIIKHHSTDQVSVGSVITVRIEGSSGDQVFTVVSSEESDILQGKLSAQSPLGEAALGRKKGESFTFEAPSGTRTCTIKDIK